MALGLTPVLISHTFGPETRRDDRRAAERVADMAQCRKLIKVIKGDYSAEETKGLIAAMDLMVGLRMHSCIAALSSGVPAISIAYGPKAVGIMGLAGQSKWVIDIKDLTSEALFELIERAWGERDDIRGSLCTHIPDVLAMAADNIGMISELVHQPKLEMQVTDTAGSPVVAQESGNVTGP